MAVKDRLYGVPVLGTALRVQDRYKADAADQFAAAIGFSERWKSDGRWFRYIKFLEEGGRTLTRSHLVVKARRP